MFKVDKIAMYDVPIFIIDVQRQ